MWIKRLSVVALLLACVVISLGAYTRLKDAGLGCPDWPGCYGHWVVPTTPEAITQAETRFPSQPVEHPKAWAEMVHRYFASTLGFLILVTAVISYRQRRQLPAGQLRLAFLLLAIVIGQGLLGKFTVTLRLDPVVVMLHLLGGFTTLSLLFLMVIRLHFPKQMHYSKQMPLPKQLHAPKQKTPHPGISTFAKTAMFCLAILVCQIGLGGWTSANYAARICPELPVCSDNWMETFDVAAALQRPSGDSSATRFVSYEHAPHLNATTKITIQMMHRIGALVTTILLGSFYLLLLFRREFSGSTQSLAATALTLLGVQVLLGLLNVILDLPLYIAVAHNGVAALSLLALISVTYSLYYQENAHHESSHYPATPDTAIPPHSMA